MNNLDFNFVSLPVMYPISEYTEEDRLLEEAGFRKVCGSCFFFIPIMGEMGLCELKKTCICKNPKDIVDMFDKKCENWKENEKPV